MTALTDQFPLRRASVWGGFRSNDAVPIRYGKVRGACVEYVTGNRDDAPRARWVWSDGACIAVDSVFVDGQPRIGGWSAKNVTDTTGKPVMMIEFSPGAEPGEGVELEAEGRGRVKDGMPIVNPAEIMADLYAFAGITAPDLQVFAIEATALGITCAGEVADAQTVQRVMRSICESIGALYSPRMRSTAAVIPGGVPELVGAYPHTQGKVDYRNLTAASADLDDTYNALRIEYAQRSGEPSRVIELEAAESIALVGRREQTIQAPWISDPGIMATIGIRILSFMARPKYVVQFTGVRGDLRPGDWIEVDGDRSMAPFATGVRQMLASLYDPNEGKTAGTFEVHADELPTVAIINNASILESEVAVATSQRVIGQNREIRLGTDSAPLSNRKVVLDGSVTRFTDGAGYVTFPLADSPRGRHLLTISLSAVTSGGNVSDGGSFEVPEQITAAAGAAELTFTMEIFFE